MTTGPTATELHQRTLTEGEPRTVDRTAPVPAVLTPSPSVNACTHHYKMVIGGMRCRKCGDTIGHVRI